MYKYICFFFIKNIHLNEINHNLYYEDFFFKKNFNYLYVHSLYKNIKYFNFHLWEYVLFFILNLFVILPVINSFFFTLEEYISVFDINYVFLFIFGIVTHVFQFILNLIGIISHKNLFTRIKQKKKRTVGYFGIFHIICFLIGLFQIIKDLIHLFKKDNYFFSEILLIPKTENFYIIFIGSIMFIVHLFFFFIHLYSYFLIKKIPINILNI